MNKLAERIAKMRDAAKADAAVAAVETTSSQANALAERMREDQIDRQAVVLFLTQIQVGPQARKRFHRIEELAADIQQRGLLQPVVVREISPHRYLLLSGERRLRALRDVLKRDMIEARILDASMDEQTWRLSQLAENLQREEYEPLELAREFQALKDQFGYTDSSLAEALHVSRTWVWKQLSLLSAPADVQEAIELGQLAATEYLNNKAIYTPAQSNDSANSSNDGDVGTVVSNTASSSPEKKLIQRIPTVAVPLPAMVEVARLLQAVAAQHGLNPIQMSETPTKKEIAAILTTRAADVLATMKSLTTN